MFSAILCVICHRRVHKQNLSSQTALGHFKNHYYKRFLIAPGKCPHPDCSFAEKFETSPDFLSERDIMLIKHFQTNFYVMKNNGKFTGGILKEKMKKTTA